MRLIPVGGFTLPVLVVVFAGVRFLVTGERVAGRVSFDLGNGERCFCDGRGICDLKRTQTFLRRLRWAHAGRVVRN